MTFGILVRRLAPYNDLMFAVIIALAAVEAVVLNAPPFVRVFPTAPLVLFLPGYLLLRILFPTAHMAGLERVLISVGSSIALTVLAGLGLAFAAIPMGSLSWTVVMAAITVLFTPAAAVRRAPAGHIGAGRAIAFRRWDAALLGVAAVAFVGIVAWDTMATAQMQGPPPAQLWMLPAANGAADASLGMRAGIPGGDYVIRLTSAGVVIHEYDLTIADSQAWETTINFTPEQRARPIVARLYEEPGENEIRFVVLQPLDG
ncbi:MAG: DUF1616 domain-containing protein [Chloroflexota bacterium]